MKASHMLIRTEDLAKARTLIHADRPYKVVYGPLVDQVFDPPQKKVIYTTPADKTLVIMVNPHMPEGDEPKKVDANQWYCEKFKRAGIEVEWVTVTYL
jgi:hypothetical protein